MDWNKYTDYHVHPQDNHLVEIVAYERLDGAWDVYVFEPTGTCPELEADRVDNNHIFVGKMESRFDINRIADTVDRQLGDEYQCEVYYREAGSRRIIGKITAHLMKQGAQHVWVRSTGTGDWELVIRRKDFKLADEVARSNVKPSP